MIDPISPESALSRLQDGELCFIVLQDGQEREAFWSVSTRRFFFTSVPLGAASPEEIEEWWPAGAKF